MVAQDYDADADAVYVRLARGKVARTVEVDSGTLADLDDAGRLVGVEVIHPDRAWPLDEIVRRFNLPPEQAHELRGEYARFRQAGRRHGRTGVIAAAGAAFAIALHVIRRILTPAR